MEQVNSIYVIFLEETQREVEQFEIELPSRIHYFQLARIQRKVFISLDVNVFT